MNELPSFSTVQLFSYCSKTLYVLSSTYHPLKLHNEPSKKFTLLRHFSLFSYSPNKVKASSP